VTLNIDGRGNGFRENCLMLRSHPFAFPSLALARFLTRGQSSSVSERHCATVATESLLHRGNSLLLLIDPALRARARLTIMLEAARSVITKTSRSHNYKQFH
jgi:hypothetical protein